MNGLKELLVGEEKRLMEIKNIVDPRLVNVPEGSLRITKSNNCTQFRYSTVESKKEIYIPKKDMMLVNALAQKTYDRKIKKIVDKRLKQIGKLSKEY
ncbi:MAG: hypothetical protein K6B41_02380, partial [Butyrivibrio sp.]|nr:hypothetical protein [Butyrivibrio sp.]